jgi:hypothetical protein
MSEASGDEHTTLQRLRAVWLTPAGISAVAAVGTLFLGSVWGAAASLGLWPFPAPTQTQEAEPEPQKDPPEPESYIFVYGTEVPDGPHFRLGRYMIAATQDRAEGQLYDSGRGYPLAEFEPGEGWVDGFLIQIDPASRDDALATQTQLQAGKFEPVPIRTESGKSATAYEWIGTPDGYPPIDVWTKDREAYGATHPLSHFDVGHCFDVGAAQNGVWVNCAAPHEWEVFYRYVYGEMTYPGDAVLHAELDRICPAVFLSWFGMPYESSGLVYRPLYPNDVTWDTDPAISCAARVPDQLISGPLVDHLF